jgi:archaellum component FlaC
MSDQPDKLVLAMLRKIDQRTERMTEDIHDLKMRMTSVEEGLAGVDRRLDRLDTRVDRIEKCLELSDVTT